MLAQGKRFGLMLCTALLAAAISSCGSSSDSGSGGTVSPPASTRIGHVFVLILENEDYANSFGASTPAPYLAQTLPAKGALVQNYYGIGHNSLDNYIAMVSGQSPNLVTQLDCQTYSNFTGTSLGANGQAIGQGCVYPSSVGSLPDQLEKAGLSWKGYMEDMGNDTTREAATCGHPAIGSKDGT